MGSGWGRGKVRVAATALQTLAEPMAVEDLGRHIQFSAKWHKIAPKGIMWNTRVGFLFFCCFFFHFCQRTLRKHLLVNRIVLNLLSAASFHGLSPIPPWPPSVHFWFELKERQGGREWSVGPPVCLIPWQTCGESKGHPWKRLWSLEPSLPSISPPWGSGPWSSPAPLRQSLPHK